MALRSLKKEPNLAERAYLSIKRAIVSSALQSGDALKEEPLCEALDISRTPLRSALHRLVAEGLAEVHGKSIIVSHITEEDITDIHKVRLHLETLVIQELQGKVTDALIEALRSCVHAQSRLSLDEPEEFMEYIEQDYRFHTTLAQATGNRILFDLVCRINTHSTRCLALSATLQRARDIAVREHERILLALEAEDYEAAMLAMQQHLGNVNARIL